MSLQPDECHPRGLKQQLCPVLRPALPLAPAQSEHALSHPPLKPCPIPDRCYGLGPAALCSCDAVKPADAGHAGQIGGHLGASIGYRSSFLSSSMKHVVCQARHKPPSHSTPFSTQYPPARKICRSCHPQERPRSCLTLSSLTSDRSRLPVAVTPSMRVG